MATDFLPGERFTLEEIEKQRSLVVRDELFREIVEKMPYPILILNSLRQVIFYNNALAESYPDLVKQEIIGKRPGEIFECIHSGENEGCGTTIFCRTCGAARAILASLSGRSDIQECRIINFEDEAFDFRVWTFPRVVDGEKFTIFTLLDITNEKRREMLERIFYHDILNTVNGIQGFLQMYLNEIMDKEQKEDLIKTALSFTKILVDEINSQRIISYAESGTLEINIEEFNLYDIVNELIELYQSQMDFKQIMIICKIQPSLELKTDKTLLRRVILNLLKNAVEASNVGSQILISASKRDGWTEIKVHNEQFMPEEVRLQVFKRSFSSKGKGRGLGTYSVKLLTEKFLKGNVSFISEEGYGTEFTITIPDLET